MHVHIHLTQMKVNYRIDEFSKVRAMQWDSRLGIICLTNHKEGITQNVGIYSPWILRINFHRQKMQQSCVRMKIS